MTFLYFRACLLSVYAFVLKLFSVFFSGNSALFPCFFPCLFCTFFVPLPYQFLFSFCDFSVFSPFQFFTFPVLFLCSLTIFCFLLAGYDLSYHIFHKNKSAISRPDIDWMGHFITTLCLLTQPSRPPIPLLPRLPACDGSIAVSGDKIPESLKIPGTC